MCYDPRVTLNELVETIRIHWALILFAAAAVGYFFEQRYRIVRIAADLKDLKEVIVGPPNSHENNGMRGNMRGLRLGFSALKEAFMRLEKHFDERLDGFEERLRHIETKL